MLEPKPTVKFTKELNC